MEIAVTDSCQGSNCEVEGLGPVPMFKMPEADHADDDQKHQRGERGRNTGTVAGIGVYVRIAHHDDGIIAA